MDRTRDAINVQRIPRFKSGVRDGERRLCPASEFEAGDAGVFDFAVERRAPDDRRGSFDRAEQVDQDFKPVAAEIHHRPASRFRLFEKPITVFTWRRVESLEGVDLRDDRFADLARCDDLLEASDRWIKSPIVSDAQ